MTEPTASGVQGAGGQGPDLQGPHLDQPLYGASFGQAFTRFWRKYATFSGRASLSEFWWAYLANALIGIVAVVVTGATGAVVDALDGATGGQGIVTGLWVVLTLIVLLGGLALILPNLAVQARRFHDADKSALLLLLWLIPYVGFIPVLIIALLPTDPRGARFDLGADPSGYPAVPYPPVPYPSVPYSPVPSPPTQSAALPAEAFAPQLAAPRPLLSQPDLSLPPAPRPQPAEPAGEQPSPPAAVSAAPAPAPVPVPAPAPVPTAAAARRAAWARVGAVQDDVLRHLLPPAGSGPAWPGSRRAFVRVSTADGLDLVASDGLTDGTGSGLGAEVYLAVRRDAASAGWRTSLLVQTAQNLAHGGVRPREQLQQHGALSISVPGIDAPADWRGPDDAVGALLGVPLPGIPDQLALPGGSAALVGVVPLRPDELQRILTDGPAARLRIATALSALSPQELTAPDRPSVA
ncbi:DUF805 domain-containing protein [uncultured Amnibacterium sp.]|uniref:DUF805 domain-containing protein n=1 Tax=uncultured Amnibacterium sp. TaxID=1631851 RepID=UPI0035CC4DDD